MSDEGKKKSTALQRFSERGRAAETRRQEIRGMAESLADSEQWGKVMGRKMSQGSLYALARMCHVTQADPILDIDLLGGHPYHNANYFIRRAQNHPRYVKHRHNNILNNQAKREEYGVPEDAMAAYEVILTIYLPSAPMDAIKAGRIPFDEAMKWTTEVAAANWAGHVKTVNTREGPQKRADAIGKTEPDKTARTRAYRRAARDAFGAEFIDDQAVQRAETRLAEEWEHPEPAQQADVGGAGEIAVGGGEPATVIDDPDLIDFETGEIVEPEPEPEPEPQVDMNELRRRYFATLRAIGITNDDGRKAFQSKHGLPDSVTKFTADDFESAHDAIMTPLRDDVEGLCAEIGTTVADVSLQELQQAEPNYANDWVHLRRVLELRVSRMRQQAAEESADDGGDDGGEPDGPPGGLWPSGQL